MSGWGMRLPARMLDAYGSDTERTSIICEIEAPRSCDEIFFWYHSLPMELPVREQLAALLQRARITAGRLVPVGKETDRRWEQGEDPSMVDSDIYVYEKRTKLVIADPDERMRFAVIGLRPLARESKLSLVPVGKVIKGKGVRPQTLSIIRQTAARIEGK
jgi:hypothetical protein